MGRVFRIIAEIANLFHAMFGSGVKRPFSRESLDALIGRRTARVVLSIPVITVTAWLLLWVAAKLFGLPEGDDPLAWIRQTFGH